MQYRINPRNGDSLSALGFGCMRFTKRGAAIDQEKADREMALALEQGVNYFDTAYIYPGSEVCLGKFMAAHGCRGRVRVATKLPQYRINRIEDAERFFAEELARLQTDYVDYYLMHMLNDEKSWRRLCDLGIREWIAEKKARGAIKNIGFSFHGGTLQFKALIDAYDWDFCQMQFNYMDEHSQAGIDGLNYAHEKGLPVVIMEPLRGGRLTDALPPAAKREFEAFKPRRSPADWGLRWIWNHPQVTVVLSGMNDVSQVEENCRVASESLPDALSPEELALYDRVLAAIRRDIKVGCTGCGYCQPCPRGVDIPTCFAAYNVSYSDGLINGMREYMMCTTLRKVRSNAGLCVKCGKCEQHCPQHIDIRNQLDNVKKRLENPIYKIAAWGAPKIMKY
ncbi:MAG: aldo/keto reductase [Clostridia bacterium]|nr:aldo/keto reductase [Clostridia bacterium]MBQ3270906.1 aldo/keto reductase [Clostridia bacterium]